MNSPLKKNHLRNWAGLNRELLRFFKRQTDKQRFFKICKKNLDYFFFRLSQQQPIKGYWNRQGSFYEVTNLVGNKAPEGAGNRLR